MENLILFCVINLFSMDATQPSIRAQNLFIRVLATHWPQDSTISTHYECVELHFNDTDGPGCIVCSMNLYSNCGAPSGNAIKLFLS